MRFTDLFIRRPVLSIVVSLMILLLGLRALYGLPIRQYPQMDNTVITITTIYPGASAEVMQGFITQPIEQAVSAAEGIDYVTSTSTLGTSIISVNVRLNYAPGTAMTDVMAKTNQVRYLLPKEAFDPIIVKTTGQTTAVMYLNFSSSQLSAAAVADYLARNVQPLLATIDGVASADILGGQTYAMRLWLDPTRMAARGVTALDVAGALLANNYQSAPGQTKGYFTIANVVANTDLKSVDEFKNMVVRAQNGALVRLKDVADVDLGPQSTNVSVLMNGNRSVFIGISATPTGNPLNVVNDVRAILPQIERGLPPTVSMAVAYDSTKFIRSSISEVEHTLGLAVIIVIIVIFLFLGTFRAVLIPVVTMPLSLIGVGIIMAAMGFSFNLLTLLAMVLAIGLVVDDAIVVVENVYRHIEGGETPFRAAIIGAREIVGPVIAMTITLAAVYTPIGFLTGLTGSLFREFAFTLAGSVVISGVIALTLSPMMASRFLTSTSQEGWFARQVDRFFSAVTRAYSRRLAGTLDYRSVVVVFAIGIFLILAYLYTHVQKELAPQEDQGVLFTLGKGPQYANLDYTEAFGQDIQKIYKSFPETDATFMINGFQGLNSSFSAMVMKPWEDRTRSTKTLSPLVQAKLNDIVGERASAFSPPALPGAFGGLPFQFVVSAAAPSDTIYKLMQEIRARAFRSHKFIFVDTDLAYNQPVVELNVDRAKASDLGINMQAIGQTLALMVGGNYVNQFDFSGRAYQVIPQVPRGDRLNSELLGKYFIRTSSGGLVPLSTVVSFKTRTDPNAFYHYDQLNSSTLSGVPFPGVSMGEAVAYIQQVANEVLPAGFHQSFLGEARQYVEEGNQLTVTFVFALVIIYLVLAAQFESLRDPLVILISVPLSICGALVPLFIGLASLNIYTQVGLVTLIGLISKHGILMTDFANQLQRHAGLDKRQAIERAAAVRLRPILMTTAAMVVGLFPLLTATGAGAASRFSIGIVIVAGMTIGTLFTLFVLPTVYTFLARDHREAAEVDRAQEAALAAE
ncbi:MAG TPA: multidrug efflux RND transporter permease subunit [Stellaceae bacterium]